MRSLFLGCALAVCLLSACTAQVQMARDIPARTHPDSVFLTMRRAEDMFLSRNLQLLAARWGIDAMRAIELQAGLWPNPNLAIEQNIYNQTTKRYFDFTTDGNSEVQIQQLVTLAGKRDKQVRLARTGTALAQSALLDLLRSLKQELRTDVYDLYFLQRSVTFYDRSVASLSATVRSAERLYDGRTILLAELLRLKSLLFSLENERLNQLTQAAAIEEDLRIMFHDTSAVRMFYRPVIDTTFAAGGAVQHVSLDSALTVALNNRPDIQSAALSVDSASIALQLQKSLAVPDVTIGGRWSRAGSYIPEYFALSVSVDLPLFNRNQGNIEAAEHGLDISRALLYCARQRVGKDVRVAWEKAMEADRLLQHFDKTFTAEYQTLVDGMIASYEKRNIRIIEFTDFFEAYRTSMIQMFQLQNSRLDAVETLNYAVGADIIPPRERTGQ